MGRYQSYPWPRHRGGLWGHSTSPCLRDWIRQQSYPSRLSCIWLGWGCPTVRGCLLHSQPRHTDLARGNTALAFSARLFLYHHSLGPAEDFLCQLVPPISWGRWLTGSKLKKSWANINWQTARHFSEALHSHGVSTWPAPGLNAHQQWKLKP